jgi:hypothetical protein
MSAKATVEGVERAFGYWLYYHPISVPSSLELAVENALLRWLDDHEEELLTLIAGAVAKRVSNHENELSALITSAATKRQAPDGVTG